jgi:hypothetical protein
MTTDLYRDGAGHDALCVPLPHSIRDNLRECLQVLYSYVRPAITRNGSLVFRSEQLSERVTR